MSLGKLIKRYREKSGLTQSQLSTKLGFTNAQFVSNIERDAAEMPNKHVKKLMKIIGIPLKEIRKEKIRSFLKSFEQEIQ